jgi:hypothetical protein
VAVTSAYKLLSETGGHPYIAEKDQARLTRHLALIYCQLVLLGLGRVLEVGKPTAM